METKDHPVPDQHGANLFGIDAEMRGLLPLYLSSELFEHLLPHFERLGGLAGGVLDSLAHAADRNPPTLEHRTRSGRDIQTIIKHPAYVALERVAFSEYGLAAMSHRGGVLDWPTPLPPAAKYALTYLYVQAEFGLCCPLSMTDSLARTLRKFGSPALIERYLPRLTTQDFDALHQGAMFMTEQGAGSDVAATETRAVPEGDHYLLQGDKWFCSNPDAGLAMVLARIDGAEDGIRGVSLFLLPRLLDDGTTNRYRIIRLKDKLGTRSMASGEIRMEGAHAYLVGDAGRGFVQMADMVNNSRLSNGVRAAGLMRRALSEAMFISRERKAFGKRLMDMPLMRRQLLKMTLPTEQARTMVFQTAEALRRSDAGECDAYSLLRLFTPLIKFRACRDARRVTGDAMEVRGGCGYIEDWSDPRIVRDAHLGSIWEGTSNIVALDVMRAIRREKSLPVLEAYLLRMLAATELHPNAREVFERALRRVIDRASRLNGDDVSREGGELHARQIGSALYHLITATAMAWEATRVRSVKRMHLAQLVLLHRLLPNDPLDVEIDEPAWLPALLEPEAHASFVDSGVSSVNLF